MHVAGPYYAYLGDLHAYTAFSDGAGPPDYAFAVARANGLHFLALADHAHDLTPTRWAALRRAAKAATEEGAFVALRGFEFVHPLGRFSVLGSSDYLAGQDTPDDRLGPFYAWLAARPGAVAGFSRPAAAGYLSYTYDAAADGRVQMLEVGAGAASGYRTYGSSFVKALAAGWRVAPANNSHTATAAWGASTRHRTGLVAPRLAPSQALQALRRRRVFATEDPNLTLTLRANGQWMGSHVGGENLRFLITFHDPDAEVVDLTLYDGGTALAQKRFVGQAHGKWRVRVPAAPGHAYYVLARQLDGDSAYTSPVWARATP